jgi:hypothetical protein
MAHRTTVVVEVEGLAPRQYTRGGETHYTKRLYPHTFQLGSWPVLYHDRDVILVRQFGIHALYWSKEGVFLGGTICNNDHPKANVIPPWKRQKSGWRISEKSLEKLKKGK